MHMTHEINLGGAIYISSKKAADISGYSQDYIGQLARGGAIIAQRVSGLWYIELESLKSHKEKAEQYTPVPPLRTSSPESEASVSFDGRDYISTTRAAKITGYNPDYVSQLARGGKVLSRQVGNRWYVDREGLLEHKNHNDALLAAVQVESVGLERAVQEAPQTETASMEPEQHFTYIPEEAPLIPTPELVAIAVPEAEVPEEAKTALSKEEASEEEEHDIPIRVLEPIRTMPRFEAVAESMAYERSSKMPWRTITVVATYVLAVVVIAGGSYALLQQTNVPAVTALRNIQLPSMNTASMPAGVAAAIDALRDQVSRTLKYSRSGTL